MLRTARFAARASAAASVAVLLTACVDPTAPETDDAGPGSGSGSVPSALVGSWRYGSISPTNFWDDHTGVFSGNAYGFSDQYVFNRDGTFKEYLYIYTQSYGCRTQAWVEMSGNVAFDSTSFTTSVAKGHFKTTYSCSSSKNVDRDMTEAERVERSKRSGYTMQVDGSGKTYLMILDGRYDPAS
jgi:hypothetical protein